MGILNRGGFKITPLSQKLQRFNRTGQIRNFPKIKLWSWQTSPLCTVVELHQGGSATNRAHLSSFPACKGNNRSNTSIGFLFKKRERKSINICRAERKILYTGDTESLDQCGRKH